MKIGGRRIEGPNVETLILPRSAYDRPKVDETGQPVLEDGQPVMEQESGDLVFKAQAVLDFDEFEKLCPTPEPPTIRKRGETEGTPDLTDLKYKTAHQRWLTQRFNWMILKSLQATPDLQWESVDMGDPDTWSKYPEEFKNAGLSVYEVNLIINAVLTANSLDDGKLQEAKKRFLATQGVARRPSPSPATGHTFTANGELAKGSA